MTCTEPYLVNRCQEIEELLKEASKLESVDEKLAAHFAAYITVLIVGVLEDCIEHVFSNRASKTGDKEVAQYIVKVVGDRFKNPDWGAISGLLKEFSEDYQLKFKDKIPHDSKEATALAAILDNKNSLAHTGTKKLEISVVDATDYYYRILPILEAIESIVI